MSISLTLSKDPDRIFDSSNRSKNLANTLERENSSRRKMQWTVEYCVHSDTIFWNHGMIILKTGRTCINCIVNLVVQQTWCSTYHKEKKPVYFCVGGFEDRYSDAHGDPWWDHGCSTKTWWLTSGMAVCKLRQKWPEGWNEQDGLGFVRMGQDQWWRRGTTMSLAARNVRRVWGGIGAFQTIKSLMHTAIEATEGPTTS